MSEPFLSFAKAYTRYQFTLKQASDGSILQMLRSLHDTLKTTTYSTEASKINGHILDETLTLLRKRYTLGVLYPILTKTDREILSVFVQNPNIPVGKEQVGLHLGQEINGDADWAIYKSVERMKKKLKGKINIKTVKGKGWMLVTQ